MADFFGSFATSASGMQVQSARLRLITENVANADTPGYRRKTVDFNAEFDRARATATVTLGRVSLDSRELEQVFSPGHPLADGSGHYSGSNVDLVIEIADARESQRSYEANLRMFDQTRQMSRAVLELLRR